MRRFSWIRVKPGMKGRGGGTCRKGMNAATFGGTCPPLRDRGGRTLFAVRNVSAGPVIQLHRVRRGGAGASPRSSATIPPLRSPARRPRRFGRRRRHARLGDPEDGDSWVLRPAILMSPPWSDELGLIGDSIKLLAVLAGKLATKQPLRSDVSMMVMPWPPRPVWRYSKEDVRLP